MISIGCSILVTRVDNGLYGPELVFELPRHEKVSRCSTRRVREIVGELLALCDEIESNYGSKLELCPFCGSRAAPDWGWPRVECLGCGITCHGKTLDEAIRNWNRRVSQ